MAGRMDHVIFDDIIYVFTACDNLCFIKCLPITFINVAILGPP